MPKTLDVPAYLQSLVHARKDEIEELRLAILDADPQVGERIKWNAPSFVWQGDDRVTMRLQPGDRVELVFHRGAKSKLDPQFSFPDPTNLINWVAQDRGVLAIPDRKSLKENKSKIAKLVLDWMRATSRL